MKWLSIPALLIVIACIAVYWMIPSTLQVVKIARVHCPVTVTYRCMASAKWPGEGFQVQKKLLNAFDVTITNGETTLPSTITLLPLSSDSTAIQWQCTVPTGSNPLTRWQRYQQAKAIRQKMTASLDSFVQFVANKQHIYGIPIKETPLTDTVLVATKTTTSSYPNTDKIYEMVNALKSYTMAQQVQPTGHPMLNISQADKNGYQVMVALPIDRRIPDKGAFFYRRMIPRKFLMTEAYGGEATVQHTHRQLQLYIDDFHRTVMAMPFQVLITDRSTESDTSKWVTRIYVPIY